MQCVNGIRNLFSKLPLGTRVQSVNRIPNENVCLGGGVWSRSIVSCSDVFRRGPETVRFRRLERV